jgi:uncharacterized membrane protein YqjE
MLGIILINSAEMIKTKKFQVTKKEYLSIIFRVLLKKKWWLFALMWLLAIVFMLDEEKDTFKVFIIIFAFLFPLITFFEYWLFAKSKQNKLIFTERQHEIYSNRIVSHLGGISESTIAMENFIKTFELKDVYLLYISKNQSIYFPKRVFETPEDENWFRNEIFLKVKNKQ